MSDFSAPGRLIFYVVRYGQETGNPRIICVESTKPCNLRSNIDLIYYVWSTFDYYCANYAMCVLPSHTSGNKIVYVRHYIAEIGGESSRLCGKCECVTKNPRMHYSCDCKRPQKCTCVVCCKELLSLKSAASKIVFRLQNEQITRFENKITYKPSRFSGLPADILLQNLLC